MRSALLLSLCAVLSACASSGEPSPPETVAATPVDGGAQCDPSVLQASIGELATPQLLEILRQRSGARHLRSAGPGMAMTMDYRQDRLTVTTDEDNRILTLSCG